MSTKSETGKKLAKPILGKIFRSATQDRQAASEKIANQLRESIQKVKNNASSYADNAYIDAIVNKGIKQFPNAKASLKKYEEFKKNNYDKELKDIKKFYGKDITPDEINDSMSQRAFHYIFKPENPDWAYVTPHITSRSRAQIRRNVNKKVQERVDKEIQGIQNHYKDLAERYNRMYPQRNGIRNKFNNLLDKGAEWGVRNPKAFDILELGSVGLAGASMIGTGYLYGNNPEESKAQKNKVQKTNENTQTLKYGFNTDNKGNVNFYNGNKQFSDYIQDSGGTIYNRQGQVIGSIGDPIAMHASGYDNIFDYNAAQAGIQPEQVAAVQQALGVTPDGKWGARTQAAYEQAMNNISSRYNPNSLFSIYQRKMQFGY